MCNVSLYVCNFFLSNHGTPSAIKLSARRINSDQSRNAARSIGYERQLKSLFAACEVRCLPSTHHNEAIRGSNLYRASDIVYLPWAKVLNARGV